MTRINRLRNPYLDPSIHIAFFLDTDYTDFTDLFLKFSYGKYRKKKISLDQCNQSQKPIAAKLQSTLISSLSNLPNRLRNPNSYLSTRAIGFHIAYLNSNFLFIDLR